VTQKKTPYLVDAKNNLLIIFVKEPKLGFVKTRIAKDTSDRFALNLYIDMVQQSIQKFQNQTFDMKLCICGDLKNTNKIFGDFDNFAQTSGDLGAKMTNAFKKQFQYGYEKIVLIGSDIPDINIDIINESFDMLKVHDMSIGSCFDGGYYLIGFNHNSFNADVFKDISWSTHRVYKQSLQKASKNIFKHISLNDIDTIDDL
jgi:rSAM/selenodomain-associated transferase 1